MAQRTGRHRRRGRSSTAGTQARAGRSTGQVNARQCAEQHRRRAELAAHCLAPHCRTTHRGAAGRLAAMRRHRTLTGMCAGKHAGSAGTMQADSERHTEHTSAGGWASGVSGSGGSWQRRTACMCHGVGAQLEQLRCKRSQFSRQRSQAGPCRGCVIACRAVSAGWAGWAAAVWRVAGKCSAAACRLLKLSPAVRIQHGTSIAPRPIWPAPHSQARRRAAVRFASAAAPSHGPSAARRFINRSPDIAAQSQFPLSCQGRLHQ